MSPNRDCFLRPLCGTDALHCVIGSDQRVHVGSNGKAGQVLLEFGIVERAVELLR